MKKIVVTVLLVFGLLFTVGSVYSVSVAKSLLINTSTPTVSSTPTRTSTPETNDISFQAFVTACTGKGENNIACIYAVDKNGKVILKLSNLTWGDGTVLNGKRGKETAQIWNQPAFKTTNTLWIVAHDFADGDMFYQLHGNVVIFLIHTDGSWEKYGVASQYTWYDVGTSKDQQVLYSRWSDPASGKPSYKKDDFVNYYNTGDLIFQTCMGHGTIIITKVVPITDYSH